MKHYFRRPPRLCRICKSRNARANEDGCCRTCARETGILPPLRKKEPKRPCRVCGVKWARKDSGGRCRKCAKGFDHITVGPIPKFWVAPELLQPRPSYERIADGIVYEVVWSGA